MESSHFESNLTISALKLDLKLWHSFKKKVSQSLYPNLKKISQENLLNIRKYEVQNQRKPQKDFKWKSFIKIFLRTQNFF